MKNLKKVLALGLALVMLLGMFTVASAAETAAELVDFDEVNHKDAVSLAVDLGIINGIEGEDGTFSYKPEDGINRASWAKMVFYAATGETSAEAYKGTVTNIKDISGHWAEGEISYLASEGYISGDTEGNYSPDSNLNVVAAYKMMLTVLGWDANDRKYQFDEAWIDNIMRDARNQGLTAGVDSTMTATAELTRDNAAQIVYNALQANMVEAEMARDNGEYYVNKYNPTGKTLGGAVFTLIKVTAKVTGLSDGKATITDVKSGDLALTNPRLVNNKIAATPDAVGQVVTFFVKGKVNTNDNGNDVSVTATSLVSSNLITGASVVLETITDGTALADLIDSDNDAYVADLDVNYNDDGDFSSANLDVYINGAAVAGVNVTSANAAEWPAAVTAAVVPGNVVELVDNDADGAIDTIKITTYSVKVATGDFAKHTTKDQVRVPGIVSAWTDSDKVTGVDGLVEGDVALVSTDGTVTVVEKIEAAFDGIVESVDEDGNIVVDGVAYGLSGIAGVSANEMAGDFSAWSDFENEFSFFLDKNGTVCRTEQITESTTSNVAYILAKAWVPATTGTGLNASTTNAHGEVELLFTDGSTQQITNVIKVGDVALKDDGGEEAFEGLAGFVEAAEGSSGWTLTAMESDTLEAGNVITATVKFADGADVSANNATTFLVGKGPDSDGNYAYTKYVGFKNVPGMTTTEDGAIVMDGSAAKYVVMFATQFSGDVPDGYIYVKSASASTSSSGKTYKIVDASGEETTMLAASDVAVEVGFYVIKSTDENGVVTGLTKAGEDSTIELANVLASGGEVFTVDGKSVSYDDATVCVLIDVKADGTFDSVTHFSPDDVDITAGEPDVALYSSVQAIVVGDNNGTASYIYMIRTAQADEA